MKPKDKSMNTNRNGNWIYEITNAHLLLKISPAAEATNDVTKSRRKTDRHSARKLMWLKALKCSNSLKPNLTNSTMSKTPNSKIENVES